mgnify:CR=1 FL=1
MMFLFYFIFFLDISFYESYVIKESYKGEMKQKDLKEKCWPSKMRKKKVKV